MPRSFSPCFIPSLRGVCVQSSSYKKAFLGHGQSGSITLTEAFSQFLSETAQNQGGWPQGEGTGGEDAAPRQRWDWRPTSVPTWTSFPAT